MIQGTSQTYWITVVDAAMSPTITLRTEGLTLQAAGSAVGSPSSVPSLSRLVSAEENVGLRYTPF